MTSLTMIGLTMTSPAARRSDAVRNHDRVIAAARELFTRDGLAVTIPQVAALAGVGKATVYRSYPAKQDLVLAVTRDGLARLSGLVTEALALDDADRAFRALVPDLFVLLAGDRILADSLFESAAESLLRDLGALAERARPVSGPVSAPVSGPVSGSGERDVRVVLCGAARQLIALDERDPEVWRRYAGMVVAAFTTAEGPRH